MVALNSQVNSASFIHKNNSFMNLKPEEDEYSSPMNDGVSGHFELFLFKLIQILCYNVHGC